MCAQHDDDNDANVNDHLTERYDDHDDYDRHVDECYNDDDLDSADEHDLDDYDVDDHHNAERDSSVASSCLDAALDFRARERRQDPIRVDWILDRGPDWIRLCLVAL